MLRHLASCVAEVHGHGRGEAHGDHNNDTNDYQHNVTTADTLRVLAC